MKDNWIKVSDRLPENENYVMVYLKDRGSNFAWYSQRRKAWFWNSFDKVSDANLVTHWKQLEAPEK